MGQDIPKRRHGVALPMLAIIPAFFIYSRLIFLFLPPVATLGIWVIAISLASFLLIRPTFKDLNYLIVYFLFLQSLIIWYFTFYLRTDLLGEWRIIGNYCGLFLIFPFILLIRNYGIERVTSMFYYICMIYVLAYVIFSYGLTNFGWFADVAPRNIILRDPARGSRLFANNTSIYFTFFCQIIYLANNRKFNLFLIAQLCLSLTAALYTQSRMAMLIGILVVLAMVFLSRGFSAKIARILTMSYVPVVLLAVAFTGEIAALLNWYDPASLSLRVSNLNMAYNLFGKYTFFGFGIPGDNDFFYRALGGLYFPEDLGGIGIAATFGVFGLIWLWFLMTVAGRGIALAFHMNSGMTAAVAYTGLFTVALSFFWPTIIYGDGAVFISLVVAIYVERDKLRHSTSYMPSH